MPIGRKEQIPLVEIKVTGPTRTQKENAKVVAWLKHVTKEFEEWPCMTGAAIYTWDDDE